MNGFIEPVFCFPAAAGGDHANGARDLAGFIGQDVSKQVFGHDHVKLAGVFHDLHGRVVHEHRAVLHVGILFLQTVENLHPEAAGVQHIVFVHHHELFPALSGCLESNAADPFDFVFGIGHFIDRHELAVDFLRFLFPKVSPANQLPDNDKVNALVRDFLFERRSIRQLRPDLRGAVIRKEFHAFAQTQQSLFRALGTGQSFPFGTANGAKQDTVLCQGFVQLMLRQGIAILVHCFPAHGNVCIDKGIGRILHFVQDTFGLGHDFRAGAVAPDQSDFLHAFLLRLGSRPPAAMISWMNAGNGSA